MVSVCRPATPLTTAAHPHRQLEGLDAHCLVKEDTQPPQGDPKVGAKLLRRLGKRRSLDICRRMDEDGRVVAVGEALWEGRARAG